MELTQKQKDLLYKKWESYYSKLELNISHCYKWLRDDYVSAIADSVDRDKNIVIDGSFRSGKSSLAIYFAKLKELGRAGKRKNVAYLDMVTLDKKRNDEYAMFADFDMEIVESKADTNDIIILDELYYTGSLDNVVKPLIKDYPDKKYVVFLHSDLRHQSWNMQVEEIETVLKPEKISLVSYCEKQEDMILEHLHADRKQADLLKRSLDGNRVLYNTLMHGHFQEGKSIEELISMFEMGFHYNTPYFPQDNFENHRIVKQAIDDGKINSAEKQRLFDFGILSRRLVGENLEESIPAPIINKIAGNVSQNSLKI